MFRSNHTADYFSVLVKLFTLADGISLGKTEIDSIIGLCFISF